jgi:mono/diheme cytochrome c family protein
MNKRTNSILSVLLVVILAGALLAACGSSSSTANPPGNASASDGQTLLQQRCSVCHGVNRVTSHTGTADQWKMVVDQMINNGAQLSSQEEQTLVTYLAQTYHP